MEKGLSMIKNQANRSQHFIAEPCLKITCFKAIIFLTCVFLLSSCSKDEKTLQTAGVQTSLYKIELLPAGATKDSNVTVKVIGVSLSDLSFQWIVNGVEIEGATKDVLNYPELKKGDRVHVLVLVKGKDEIMSDSLIIANSAPQIKTIKLAPRNPKKGEKLRVSETEAYDADGDAISFTYAWFINSEPIGIYTDVLDTTDLPTKRGARISVKITPTDREQEGKPIILNSIIANSPPKVSPQIKAEFNGLVYTSKIMAEDPEGDILTYTLKKASEGMTIDSKSGVITWQVKPEDKGEHEITVSVSDGQGGEVVVLFTTTINFTSPE